MNSDEGVEKIRAIFILEVLGRPPEHLVESLEEIINNIGKEKGVVVKRKEIKKPEPMKDQKDFYTTFGEVEIEAEELPYLVDILFKYMPAHVEIISPELITLPNNGWNDILNELARRLHGYDEIARILQVEKQALLRKVQEHGIDVPEQPLLLKVPEPEKPVKKSKSKKKIKKKRA